MDAHRVIEQLDLSPHPEGGFYRQTFADEHSTAIYYLLEGSAGWSRWHRVLERTEVWHAYAGATLELEMGQQVSEPAETVIRLGNDLASGDVPQVVVPPGLWQRSRSLGGWSLAGCTVSPPFTFSAFELR